MSLNKKIATNTIIQIVGKIITTALGLISFGMIAHYLGTEKFGWYITAISFLQFVGILTDFGLIPVSAQMLGEGRFETNRLVRSLIGYRLYTSIFFLGLAPLIALLFPYSAPVKWAILISTINFLCIALNQVFTGFLQSRLQMHIQAVGEIVGRIALIICLIPIIHGNLGFFYTMLALSFSSLFYTGYMYLKISRDVHLSPIFDKEIWLSITKKMWPIAISIIFNVIYLRGDIILLSFYRPSSEVGIYGAAYRVLDIVSQTAMMLMGLLLPLLARAHTANARQEFANLYQKSFDYMMMISIPATIGTILLANPIMTLVAGNDFVSAGAPLKILAVAVFGVFLGAIFGHTAVAIDRQKSTMWIYVSDAILTLLGYLYFIPRYGWLGAAWMTVFSEIYAGLCLYLTIRRITKIKLHLTNLTKILIASLFMATIIYFTRSFHVILVAILGIAAYTGATIVLGIVSRETLAEIFATRDIKKTPTDDTAISGTS
ncbi:MAG TPA: flippase [Candidatus Magasanikbacteria bacterium]|nr:flippase [Candidatus Magasanikbacteria bacterium]